MKIGRKKTPTVIQMEAVECGAACLCMILGSFGRYVPLAQLRQECGVSRDGSNAANLFRAAGHYGLVGKGFRLPLEDLYKLEGPFIAFWEANHYIVVEGFNKKGVYINDPGTGPRFISHHEFEESYFGIVLTFTRTSAFKKGGDRPNMAAEVFNRLKPIRLPILYLVLAGLCLLLPGLALPAFIRFFVDHVIVSRALGAGTLFLTAMAMILMLGGALFFLQNYFLNRLHSRLSIEFGSQFLWHILRLPISFYAQRFPGEIAWRTTINERVSQQMTGVLANTCIDVLLIIFYGVVMLRYDVLIGSIGFLAVILNVGLFLWIQRARRDAYARLHQEEAKWIGNTIGALQQIETIKAVGLESDFFVKFAGLYTKNLNAQAEISKKDAILGTAPIAIQALSMAALLTIGGWKIMEGNLTFGMLIALQALMIAFLTPIARFVNLGQVMQNTGTDIVRLDDVLKNKIDPVFEMRNEAHHGGRLEGYLEFKNVTFGYSQLAPPLIKQLNFAIKPGQRLALVGPSGCGKSTLAKLAAGLFLPWEGEILYDGKPMKEIPSHVFYHSLGYIDQQIFLFSGTIYENLTLWNPAVAEKMVIRAAEDAEIHEDILLRPNGYQNRLVENGKNLSGGQQQRLEIARALLYSPSILVMDEATSALDSHSEKAISDNIRRRGCSALMIAHRLSTIQDCDEIIVLDKGNVSQRGTHAQLREQPGIYKELIESE